MAQNSSFLSLYNAAVVKQITVIHMRFSHTLKSTKVSVMREPSSAIIFHSHSALSG